LTAFPRGCFKTNRVLEQLQLLKPNRDFQRFPLFYSLTGDEKKRKIPRLQGIGVYFFNINISPISSFP
jgi:hypothetical protein